VLDPSAEGPSAPRALLLDADGVVFAPMVHRDTIRVLTEQVVRRLTTAAIEHDVDRVRGALEHGLRAISERDAALRHRRVPREVPAETVAAVLTAELDADARSALLRDAAALSGDLDAALWQRDPRPQAVEAIAVAHSRGIPVALIGDAPPGHRRRALLSAGSLSPMVAAQVFSEEVGVRRPHPRSIEVAAALLGVHPVDAWYVGSHPHRDLLAARRAGVGHVITVRDEPDVATLVAGLRDSPAPRTRPRTPRRGTLLTSDESDAADEIDDVA